MGKQIADLRLRRGPRAAAVLTFVVLSKVTGSVSHSQSTHIRKWALARWSQDALICTLVVTGRLVGDETQIGAPCAAALSRGPAGQVRPVAGVSRRDCMRLKWSSRA